MRRAAWLVLTVLAGALLPGPVPALAHVRPAAVAVATAPALVDPVPAVPLGLTAVADASRIVAAPAASALPVALALALATALVLARRRLRPALVAGLTLVLALFALEQAVHSVHHLDDPHAATRCAVASVGTQLDGTTVEAPAVEIGTVSGEYRAHAEAVAPAARPLRPDAGRAPPAA